MEIKQVDIVFLTIAFVCGIALLIFNAYKLHSFKKASTKAISIGNIVFLSLGLFLTLLIMAEILPFYIEEIKSCDPGSELIASEYITFCSYRDYRPSAWVFITVVSYGAPLIGTGYIITKGLLSKNKSSKNRH